MILQSKLQFYNPLELTPGKLSAAAMKTRMVMIPSGGITISKWIVVLKESRTKRKLRTAWKMHCSGALGIHLITVYQYAVGNL